MIMAHNLWSVGACGSVGAEKHRGINFEAMPWICRNIGGGQDSVDTHCCPIAE